MNRKLTYLFGAAIFTLLFLGVQGTTSAGMLYAAADDFVITVDTDAYHWMLGNLDSTDFWIPTVAGETYNYNIDCDNDGINDAEGVTGYYVCEYPTPGVYTIRIKDNAGDGTGFPRLRFYGQPSYDSIKIQSIDQWGTGKWTSMESAFYGCSNLSVVATDAPDLSGVTSLANMFRETSPAWGSFTSFNHWDTSTITDMSYMFSNSNLGNLEISSWNTQNVTNMAGMFMESMNMVSDISGWNTSSVTDMSDMFNYAADFNQNLGDWNVGSLTDATDMFLGVTLLTDYYDGLLNNWGVQSLHSGVSFNGGDSSYCNGEVARNYIVNVIGWTITDGGKNCALVPPFMATPDSGETVAHTDVVFGWRQASLGNKYTLEVRKSDDTVIHLADHYAADVCNEHQYCSVTISGDLDYGDYQWRVRAWSGLNASDFSAFVSFVAGPNAPVLDSPAHNATLYTGRPTFVWYPDPDATGYEIQLRYWDGFSPVGEWSIGPECSSMCSFQIPAEDDLGTDHTVYTWSVRTYVNDIPGPWAADEGEWEDDWRVFVYAPISPTIIIGPPDGTS
ncbi:MAG: BspA family leucine-rich repeat surface protein, partial [Anaerolineae bacterium]|nr:BspA family leucine-rich repeat surface protein [Anaerolineae bacterium]